MLSTFDDRLLLVAPHPALIGVARFATEFLYFGIKEARACCLYRYFLRP